MVITLDPILSRCNFSTRKKSNSELRNKPAIPTR